MFQAIYIQLSPSRPLLGLLLAISIVACGIILSLPISPVAKFAIIALILLSGVFFILRDVLLLLPNSWKILEVNSKGNLILSNKSGEKIQLTAAPSSFIHAACSVLNFKRVGYNFALPPVILLPNADNADELRRLRVWLRWAKQVENQEDLAADLAE